MTLRLKVYKEQKQQTWPRQIKRQCNGRIIGLNFVVFRINGFCSLVDKAAHVVNQGFLRQKEV